MLGSDFYQRDDVVTISRELLGKVLCTGIDGALTRAMITETEAYAGVGDKASHAYGGRRNKRTEPMFSEGGTATFTSVMAFTICSTSSPTVSARRMRF